MPSGNRPLPAQCWSRFMSPYGATEAQWVNRSVINLPRSCQSFWIMSSRPHLVTSRSREIRVYTFPIALEFDMHFDSSAVEMLVKFRSDTIIIMWITENKKNRQVPFHDFFMYMMTSSNGSILRVTGPLCGESTGPRWIPCTKASDAELWCFLWSAPE